jgi:uncharacterized pyridoxamine 5'-phosphate oxidase family protein
MCMLVKFHEQFVYILVRIEFPSNWALKEQVMENRPKFKPEIYKIISGQPQNALVKFT